MDLLDNILGDMKKGDAQKASVKKRDMSSSGGSSTSRSASGRPSTSSEGSGGSGAPPGSFRIPKRAKIDEGGSSSGSGSRSERGQVIAQRGATSSADTFQMVDVFETQCNTWAVDVSRMDEIERLHIDVFIVPMKKGKPLVANGEIPGIGDLARQYRQWALWVIWQETMATYPHLFAEGTTHENCAYDCGATVYLPKGVYRGKDREELKLYREKYIKDTKDEKGNKIKYKETEEDEKRRIRWQTMAKLTRITIKEINIDIKRNHGSSKGIVYTKKPKAYEADNRSEFLRCLEVISSQITFGQNFFTFGNSTYTLSSDGDNKCQFDEESKEIKTGFLKSVRLIDGNEKVGQPAVGMTIDIKRSPFYQAHCLLAFIMKIYNIRQNDRNYNPNKVETLNPREVDRLQQHMHQEGPERTEKKLDELRGIAVKPIHLAAERNLSFFISGFSKRNAREETFDYVDPETQQIQNMSVEAYYLKQYSRRLKYPLLPLALQKKRDKVMMWPIEVLEIHAGQRVKQQNISSKMHQDMTGCLSLLPEQFMAKCARILDTHLDVDNDVYLKNFKIRIFKGDNRGPMKTVSRILPAPVIRFGSDAFYQPISGVAKRPTIQANRKEKFLQPARVKSMTVLNFDQVMRKDRLQEFCRVFESKCSDQGIHFETRSPNWNLQNCSESDPAEVEHHMRIALKNKDTCVLCVCKDRKPDVHDVLKMWEAKLGMQTYQLSLATCDRMMSQGGKQTTDNVIRKFNPKAGGVNFKIALPAKVSGKSVCPTEREVQKKLYLKTMFVGIEMSHAGSQCLFDRQNNISSGEPSVVGISYSLKTSTELGGIHYLQKPREHSLLYLDKYFPKVVLNHMAVTQSLPDKIVIYRTGSGEGSFPKITEEVEQMRKILKTDAKILEANKKRPYEPQIMLIVVQKTSNHKIFPCVFNGRKAFDQNVPSGVCIEAGITSLGLNEFILVSQIGQIGVVRPTRFTILANDMDWTKNEIAHMTYFSAFGHQVSYGPPGVPDVTYAAENLAKRGRNNFKSHQRVEQVQRAYNQGTEDNDEGQSMFQLSETLNRCAISTKNFWA